MSDYLHIRSSPPVTDPLESLLSREPSEAISQSAIPVEAGPIVVDLISSDSVVPGEIGADDRAPAEFSDLVEQTLSPHVPESNQHAQLVKEKGRFSEEKNVSSDEYELQEQGSLKRKVLSQSSKGKQPMRDDPSGSEADKTSVISDAPDASVKVPQASRLQVIGITSQDAIKNAVAVWSGKLEPSTKSSNASIQHNNIRALRDADLAYPGQGSIVKKYGHCMYWMSRVKQGGNIVESPKLIEGGTNNDAPRVTFTFPGVKAGTKFYIYHVIAMEAALTNKNKHLTMEKLEAVSKKMKSMP